MLITFVLYNTDTYFLQRSVRDCTIIFWRIYVRQTAGESSAKYTGTDCPEPHSHLKAFSQRTGRSARTDTDRHTYTHTYKAIRREFLVCLYFNEYIYFCSCKLLKLFPASLSNHSLLRLPLHLLFPLILYVDITVLSVPGRLRMSQGLVKRDVSSRLYGSLNSLHILPVVHVINFTYESFSQWTFSSNVHLAVYLVILVSAVS